MRDQHMHLVMVDRVQPDGTIEAEPVTVLPLIGGGCTLVLDDGQELRFHRSEWAEVTGQGDDAPWAA